MRRKRDGTAVVSGNAPASEKRSRRSLALDEELTLDIAIANSLLLDIIAWRIPPGSWIREREISERFECSHSPVREAFRHLVQDGFIVVEPWQGARVVDLDHYDIHEILECLRLMFSRQCGLVAEVFDLAEADTLRALHKDYVKCLETPNSVIEQVDSLWLLGGFIHERCPNVTLSQATRRISRIAHWQHRVLADPSAQASASKLRETFAIKSSDLVDAILRRDADGAEAAANGFVRFSQDNLAYHIARLISERTQAAATAKPKRRRKLS